MVAQVIPPPKVERSTDLLRADKYYVYSLAYPNGDMFYIGKGKGDRINHHERGVLNGRGANLQKETIIRKIWANGEQVTKTVLAEFDTEKEALLYEAALIFFMDGLTNIATNAQDIEKLIQHEERKRERRENDKRFISKRTSSTALRAYREGLTPKTSQEDLARRAGITLQTYRNAESGKNCTYTTATAILRALNEARGEQGQEPVTLEQLGLSIV